MAAGCCILSEKSNNRNKRRQAVIFRLPFFKRKKCVPVKYGSKIIKKSAISYKTTPLLCVKVYQNVCKCRPCPSSGSFSRYLCVPYGIGGGWDFGYEEAGGRTIMLQEQEQRHIYYDRDLDIEAYNLSGIVQKFPNHFHEYYVIGFVEGGKRHLWCKGREYDVSEGDLLLFNPRDNHYCAPINGEILDYRAVNVNPEVMERSVKEITGEAYMPYFTETVVYKSDITQSVRDLYRAILDHAPRLEKEETLFFLIEQILQEYASDFEKADILQPNPQIRNLCSYMETHYAENLTLDDLLAMTDFGKSYLLRSFTKQTGVSPYRYLQTIRLDKAKKLLEQGIAPIDAAGMAGFADQSHFTHFFKDFIGLTPKQYQRIFQNKKEQAETDNDKE